MNEFFILLIIYQVKHFLCDFPLQTEYMLKKMADKGWFAPLFSHALVHAVFTMIIVAAVNINLWWLAVVDLVAHFSMDRIKASPRMLNRFTLDNKFFWWSLGFDQMIHHLTHYFIIYIIVTM